MKIIIYLALLLLTQTGFSQCFPDRHSTDWFDGWVSCEQKISPNPLAGLSHWILYDLQVNYEIDKIKIWNSNDPAHLQYGAKTIQIDYSEDSLIWKDAGTISLKIGEGTNRYEGQDWFPLSIPKARFILVTVVENYGGSCSGFAEIRFSGEKLKLSTSADEEKEIESTLSLSSTPNPFKDDVRIKINSNNPGDVSYTISSLMGQIIQTGKLRMNRNYYYLDLPTKNWLSGLYQVQIQQGNQNNRMLIVKM